MSQSNLHSPEPWQISAAFQEDGAVRLKLLDANGLDIHTQDLYALKNTYKRIVACVNFCSGLSTEVLEWLLVLRNQHGQRIEATYELQYHELASRLQPAGITAESFQAFMQSAKNFLTTSATPKSTHCPAPTAPDTPADPA